MLSKIDVDKKRKIDMYLYPFVLLSIFYLIIGLTLPITFHTNDERFIADTLSGVASGIPDYHIGYCSYFFMFILSRMYMYIPLLPWWTVYHLVAIAIGTYLSLLSVFRMFYKKKKGYVQAIIICVLLEVLIFLFYTIRLAFTVTPAILATGIIATIFTMDECKSKKGELFRWGFMLIGMAFAYMQRKKAGQVEYCFFLLGVLYYYISQISQKDIRHVFHKLSKVLLVCIAVVASIFVVKIGNKIVAEIQPQISENGKDINFETYKAAFWNYPHVTYEENPELYQGIGWDENLYRLASEGFFTLDDKCDVPELKQITNEKANNFTEINIKGKWWNPINTFWKNGNVEKIMVGLLALCCLGELFFWNQKRYKSVEHLVYFLNVLGGIILLFYQSIHGRMLLRTVTIVIIPMVMICTLLLIKNIKGQNDNRNWVIFSTYIGGGILSCFMLASVYNVKNNYTTIMSNQSFADLYRYASQNLENIYIYDLSVGNGNNAEAFLDENNIRAYNLFSWSFSGNTIHVTNKLQMNHLDKLNTEVLKKDNAYYVTQYKDNWQNEMGYWMKYMYQYMQENYGVIGVELIDQVEDEYMIFHFIFSDVPSQFSGWKTENGQISYYVDGKRQEGFFDVGDKTYYGIQDSQFKQIEDGKYVNYLGAVKTGWLNLDGDVYYFNEFGEMQVGQVEIDGVTYQFSNEGKQEAVLHE